MCETAELFLAARLEDVHDAVGVEALIQQVPIETLELLVVLDAIASEQPARQRGFEQRVGIELAEDVVDRLARGRRGDSGAFDLHPDAQLAAAPRRRFRARDGFGDAYIVNRAFFLEARHRGVDGRRLVTFAGEALADLGFGQFAAGRQLEAVHVGVRRHASSPGEDLIVMSAQDYTRSCEAPAWPPRPTMA